MARVEDKATFDQPNCDFNILPEVSERERRECEDVRLIGADSRSARRAKLTLVSRTVSRSSVQFITANLW